MIVANRPVDQSRKRGQGRSQKLSPDRVAGDAAARVPGAESQGRGPDYVCAALDRGPEVDPSRAIAPNRPVDPFREKDRVPSAGAALDRAAGDAVARAVNRDQDPEYVALDPESRAPRVAPSLVAAVTGGGATQDLPLSKSLVRDRERRRPSRDRAAVPGHCQSLQVKEVALGPEMFLRIMSMRT